MYLIGWVIFLVVTYVLYLRNNTKNKPTAPSQYDRPTYFEDTHTIPENRGPDDMNVSERKLFEALKRLGLDPVPQYPVDQCTLDFAFPEDHLAIEVNGPYHYTVEGKERDRRRKKFLHHTYPPWKVRSYRAEQVFANSDGVAREIKRILEKDRSP
jgi:very-short-patch-repair endonuclease